MKQQQAGHILLPAAQSHLNKRLPQSTSYVYRNESNEISRTLFNLQLRAMRKPIGWQILDNCFVCFRSSTGGEPRKTNKEKKREIKIKLGDTCYCYLWVVAELRRMGSDGDCEILGPSSYGIMSILHIFFHSALFQKLFWRRGYHAQNLYRIRLQIIKLYRLFEALEM